jgi:hypothetical protein
MTAAFGVQAKESRYIGGRTALARRIPPKKNIERPEGDVVYYSMKNLRGRIGSTRLFMRGLGCNADSSNFGCELRSGPHSAGQCCHINDIRNGRSLLKRTGGSILVRSQQLYFSRSRMGSLVPNAHARDAAVAQRLHSATFGGGETQHENAKASKVGGPMKSAPPCLQSLL